MDVNGTRFHLLLGRRDFAAVAAASRAGSETLWRWLEAAGVPVSAASQAAVDFRPLAWDNAWEALTLVRQLPRLKPPSGARALNTTDRRGAAADPFGNIFWVDTDRARIRVRPAGMDAAGVYWAITALDADTPSADSGPFQPENVPAPGRLPTLSGLTVTTSHYLVAGTLAPAGLLIFDLHSAGGPTWWRWPAPIGFVPIDLAASVDGGVVVLDRPDAGAARLWRLDRDFNVVDLGAPVVLAAPHGEDFHAEGSAPRVRGPKLFGGPVHIAAGSPVDAQVPVAVVELPDRSVLILDPGAHGAPARVQRWRGAKRTNTIVLDAAATRPHLASALTGVHDFAVLLDSAPAPGTVTGRLFLVTQEAAQVFALHLFVDGDNFRLNLEAVALPLQRFAGKGLVTAGTQVFYDSAQRDAAAQRWVALVEQPRYRYFSEGVVEGETKADPTDDVLVFDGKQPDCVWHRVLLDAFIPVGCEVRIESRAADARELLDDLAWQREPVPYRRENGSELAFDQPFGAAAASDPRLGTYETLLQAASGRYLALRLTLRGDGRASPRLRALRAYYPRFSYLQQYLPAAYREDTGAVGFLERYLCNAEGMYTAIEGRVESAEMLFDPTVAPAGYLPWLAGWLGAMLEDNWEEARRRLYLRYAWLLFRWRGTPLALAVWLRLATDPCPDETIFAPLEQEGRCAQAAYGASRVRIVEGFELRRFPALLPADPSAPPAPAVLAPTDPWQPSQGSAVLHARFAQFLRQRYAGAGDAGDADALVRLADAWQLASAPADFAQLRFSAVLPDNAAKAADWRAFTQVAFDFSYAAVRSTDAGNYREFLARRYGHIEALNQAHLRTGAARWANFAAVSLPAEDEVPTDGTPLTDWIQFVSLALPVARGAHRFTVLVPASPREAGETRAQRAAQVEALVRREKPAHTDFEVKLFWALFQVGTARLGIDSVLGEGGRFVAMVLDAGYLGEGYLAEGHPWSATDRTLVGRDRMQG